VDIDNNPEDMNLQVLRVRFDVVTVSNIKVACSFSPLFGNLFDQTQTVSSMSFRKILIPVS
jgi:hypothetical protein